MRGSPLLSRTTHPAGASVLDHQRVDFVLRDALGAAALAHVEDFSARCEIENRLRNKVIVKDYIRGPKQTRRFEGEEIGIAGTSAHEIHLGRLAV